MEQLKSHADNRLVNGCVYCGGHEETRDHVPSRVFLNPPYPENLPVVAACLECNNSFSRDEEYFACLIESAIAGSTDPEHIRRPVIANILRRKPALHARIEAAKNVRDGQPMLNVEIDRAKNVLLKLARGHAAFELCQICRKEPRSFWWSPLALLSDDERDSFDSIHVVEMLGEVGSRNTQRLFVTQVFALIPTGEQQIMNLLLNDWVEVQENCYRFIAIDDNGEIKIKIVIGEYLACEATWAR